jgi:MFS family permease
MAGNATFPALLPEFQAVWSLTSTEAGWINGIYYAGYIAAVPVLVTLTDRMSARVIYIASASVGSLAALGFAAFADSVAWAIFFRVLGGVGLAGTYMVGLRLLTDCLSGDWQARGISWYTAAFALGVAASVFLAGELAALGGWRLSYAVAGALTAGAVILIAIAPKGSPGPRATTGGALDLRPALRNRESLAYNIGYALHIWELFGWRSWIVAFLVFVLAAQGQSSFLGLTATQAASVLLMLGLPASVRGNEAALKYGRRPVIAVFMLLSGGLILLFGFGTQWPFWLLAVLLVAHSVFVMADSSALTAGAVLSAQPERKGATMAVHALLGFGVGIFSPLAFGVVLDFGGGAENAVAWALSFSLLSVAPLVAPILLYRLRGEH